ncbi:MAG: hypothetical protein KAJ03_01420 [Gammaproteobacteria bacterium]|nr:hypothetical protein [Gammaproteobacteria bacterium]
MSDEVTEFCANKHCVKECLLKLLYLPEKEFWDEAGAVTVSYNEPDKNGECHLQLTYN